MSELKEAYEIAVFRDAQATSVARARLDDARTHRDQTIRAAMYSGVSVDEIVKASHGLLTARQVREIGKGQ